jgi:hypothetical protein
MIHSRLFKFLVFKKFIEKLIILENFLDGKIDSIERKLNNKKLHKTFTCI